MKKIMPPNIKLYFVNSPESERRLKTAYLRILDIAKKNILERKRKLLVLNKDNVQ